MADIVKYWKAQWNAHGGGQYAQKPVAAFVKKLLRLSGKEKLLEVGCGEALLLSNLPAKEKTGVDYSTHLLAKAKKRLPKATFILGEADDLPFADGSFDRVLCHSVIHYYSRPYAAKAISELERACRKGGVIVVGDVPDASQYPGGRLAAIARTKLLELAGKPHSTYYDKRYFTARGYAVTGSPFNKRFYASKTKK